MIATAFRSCVRGALWRARAAPTDAAMPARLLHTVLSPASAPVPLLQRPPAAAWRAAGPRRSLTSHVLGGARGGGGAHAHGPSPLPVRMAGRTHGWRNVLPPPARMRGGALTVLLRPMSLWCRTSGPTGRQWAAVSAFALNGRGPRGAAGALCDGAGAPQAGGRALASCGGPVAVQRRGLWTPRSLNRMGVPWIVQIFYGTVMICAAAVLVMILLSASVVVGALLLVVLVVVKLFTRYPRQVASMAQRYQNTPAGFVLRPLLRMMTENFMFTSVGHIRQAIEADVLRVVNSHKRLARFGDDFEAVGIHRMSVQMVDGERAVGLEFPILSSKHAELHVEVLARQHGPSGVQDDPEKTQWEYESVVVRSPDGKVVDITPDLLGGNIRTKSQVIDASFRIKKED